MPLERGRLADSRTIMPRSQEPKWKDIVVALWGCATDEAGTGDGKRPSTPGRDQAVRGAWTPPIERRSGDGRYSSEVKL